MTEKEKNNILNSIFFWEPQYNIESFTNKSDSQLYAIYKSLMVRREKLIKQVFDLTGFSFSIEELRKMSNVELRDLREQIMSFSVDRTNKNDGELSEELQELTYEELYKILGDEPANYSESELRKKGYILDKESKVDTKRVLAEQQNLQEKRKILRDKIIYTLFKLNNAVNLTNILDINQLKAMSFEKLVKLYKQLEEKYYYLPDFFDLIDENEEALFHL